MLISFTGAQCTGKSTLLKKMFQDEKYRKCTFIKEVTRKVASKGHMINDSGNDITQLMILNEHLNNHMLTGCTVLDRCILDGLIYTQWLHENNKVSKWVLEYARNLYHILVEKLDVIFYTDPIGIELVDDGQRSINEQFRNDIITSYNTYFKMYPEVRDKTVVLSGNVESRYKQIKQTFKNYEQVR